MRGCLQEVRTLVDPASIRNLVRVDRFDPEGTGLDPVVVRDDASIALYRVRPVTTGEEDLDLA